MPKITPNRSNKLPNVPSEILKNPYNPRTDQGGKGNPRSPTYLEETPGRTPHRWNKNPGVKESTYVTGGRGTQQGPPAKGHCCCCCCCCFLLFVVVWCWLLLLLVFVWVYVCLCGCCCSCSCCCSCCSCYCSSSCCCCCRCCCCCSCSCCCAAAGAASPAAATGAAGLQNVPFATPKHHGPEGRTSPRSPPKKCLTLLLKP